MAGSMRQFPWFFSFLWLVILLVMISAGFWQLRRAELKQQINIKMAAAEVNKPQTWEDWKPLNAFDSIETRGRFLNTHFLLDNQIMDGQVGYFVFSVMRTNDGVLLLVNRGWTDDNSQNFEVSTAPLSITALLADWPRPGIQLGEQTVKNQSLQHVTYLDQDATTSVLKKRHCDSSQSINCVVLPTVLKLDPSTENGFKRDWQLPRMTVEKHRAYAAQWFTMSLVLCLIYGIFIRKIYANKN